MVTLFRFGLTAVFVTAIPWLSPEARAEVAPFEWIFPLASLVVMILSAWFISEDWVRARSTYSKIKELRGKDDPDYARSRWTEIATNRWSLDPGLCRRTGP